jgi:Xaa-Pro aminopeptidase
MKPGTTIEMLNKEARALLEEKLVQLGLLGREEIEKQDPSNPAFKRFTIHGLSHFIGLDVHDPGDQQLILEPGMVLSCEPGIYIPAEKLGIRIEDQVLITDREPEILTSAVPVNPEDLYACLDAAGKK